MIRSFRNNALRRLWESGKELPQKTLIAEELLDILDVIDAAGAPYDPAFVGFRFDEWIERKAQRYGIQVSDHWLISYGWTDGHATDVDLERIE